MKPTIRFPTRLFLAYSRFSRGMTLGVRGAVFDPEGRILLVRHSYVPGWYMPGGGVEPGEPMHAALDRELIEESGIALTGPAQLFGLYWNARASPRDHVARRTGSRLRGTRAMSARRGRYYLRVPCRTGRSPARQTIRWRASGGRRAVGSPR